MKLVAIIGSEMRETDLAGRLGGEEFLVVMPGLEKASAVVAAERFREAVGREQVDAGDAQFVMTVSLGIAFFRNGDSVDRLIARADTALYAAKNRGRNCTEIECGD